jgi:DNA-directed RNA polymerase subunit RPC12/RpoP
MDETTWATVTKPDGMIVAEMLVERLKAADIPAFAVQESVGQSFGFTVGPLSDVYVKVPVEYLEEARLLLDIEAPVDQADLVVCPNCESEIELNEAEWEQGWYTCPECAERITIE